MDNISTTPRTEPFWKRADALVRHVYLHPADPVAPLPVLDGYKVLARPMWGWGVEAGSHALRSSPVVSFDRYPSARLILGHLGETLPFSLWRFDSRANSRASNLPNPPSYYIKATAGDAVWHVRLCRR